MRAGALLSRISSARTRPLRTNGRDAFRCRSMTRTCAARRAAGHEALPGTVHHGPAPAPRAHAARTHQPPSLDYSNACAHHLSCHARCGVPTRPARLPVGGAGDDLRVAALRQELHAVHARRVPLQAGACQQSLRGAALHEQPARHKVRQALVQASRPAQTLPRTRAVRHAAASFPSGRARAQRDGRKCCVLHRSTGAPTDS